MELCLKRIEHYVEGINSIYEEFYEFYPQFPKLSTWRMMAKAWIQKVYFN